MGLKNACCVWDFTISCEKQPDYNKIRDACKQSCKKWVFQKEEGESGYIHWQGRISLKQKSRVGPHWDWGEHWSPTSSVNRDNDFYVIKNHTRIEGPWKDCDPFIPRQVLNIKLKKWQQKIADDASIWNTRNINIIIDKEGGIGKSTLVNYLSCRGLCRRIPAMESYKDFMRMVADCPKSNLYLVDFPRAINKAQCQGFWAAIESVKDGYAYDDRYKFKECFFNCPNIWVFTNRRPDTELLSQDRWLFWEVSEGELKLCNTTSETTGTGGTEDKFAWMDFTFS